MEQRGAMTVKQFRDWAGIGLTKVYEEIAAGRLPLRKLGRKSLIRMVDAEAWLAALPAEVGPPVRKQTQHIGSIAEHQAD